MCVEVTVCGDARSCGSNSARAAHRARTALATPARMPHPTVATRTTTLTARLREGTASVRDDREILAGRVSWLDYRLYLLRMYGFYASIERALGTSRQLAEVVSDAPLRNHKAALVAHDLVALGVDRRELAEIPRMMFTAQLALPE